MTTALVDPDAPPTAAATVPAARTAPAPDSGPEQVREVLARRRAAAAAAPAWPYLVPVPDCEPPYDDERTATDRVRLLRPDVRRRRTSYRSAVAAPATVAADVPQLVVRPGCRDPADAGADLPAPGRAGAMLARGLVEVLSGIRPVEQLRSHCAPEVFAGLEDLPVVPGTGLPQVRSVHTSRAVGRSRRGVRGIPPVRPGARLGLPPRGRRRPLAAHGTAGRLTTRRRPDRRPDRRAGPAPLRHALEQPADLLLEHRVQPERGVPAGDRIHDVAGRRSKRGSVHGYWQRPRPGRSRPGG